MSALWEDRGSPAAEINTSSLPFFFMVRRKRSADSKEIRFQGKLLAIAQSGGCSPAYADWKRQVLRAPVHVHRSRQAQALLFPDWFFLWLPFPVCQERTARLILWKESQSWKARNSKKEFSLTVEEDEGSTEESGPHWPDVGSHGWCAYICGHAQSTVGEL